MLESLNDWTINLKNGHQTRVVSIDFARAFDSVCHKKLLLKLKNYGIGNPVLKIIESYLLNRSQCVVIENEISDPVELTSGVPQGGVLGLLLFVVYINDLSEILTPGVILKLFADDAKLYTEIKTGDNVDELQICIDNLSCWAKTWQLSISISKCALIDIGYKNEHFYENKIDGDALQSVDEFKDLGVVIDNKLTFSSHITQMVAKAEQRLFYFSELSVHGIKCRCLSPINLSYFHL